jgi:hypothetical protein
LTACDLFYLPHRTSSNRRQRTNDDDPQKANPNPAEGKTTNLAIKKLSASAIDEINEIWENTEETSMMWEIISNGKLQEFISMLQDAPELVHVRSADGRGPMWWAYEYKRPRMIEIMQRLGASEERTDKNGVRPTDLRR